MAAHVKNCLSYPSEFWFQNFLDRFFFSACTMSWAAFDKDGEGNLQMNATGGRPPSLGMMLIMQQVQKVLDQKDAEDAMEKASKQTLTTQDTTNVNEEQHEMTGTLPASSSSLGTTLAATSSSAGVTSPTEMQPKPEPKKSSKKSRKGKGKK